MRDFLDSFRVPGGPGKNSPGIVGRKNQHAIIPQYAVEFCEAPPPRFARRKIVHTIKGHHHGIEGLVTEWCKMCGIRHQELELRKLLLTSCDHLWRVVHTYVARRQAGEMWSRTTAPNAEVQNCVSLCQEFVEQRLLAWTEVIK